MKDYNIMSIHGMTDQEYVDEYDMPQELVGKPEMNDWIINKVHTDNINAMTTGYIDEGMDPDKAVVKATQFADNSRKAARINLKKITKKRGY